MTERAFDPELLDVVAVLPTLVEPKAAGMDAPRP